MEYRGGLALGAKGLAVSLFVTGMLLLAACSATTGELPASHVDDEGSVNIGHARCGACHMDGQRDESNLYG